MTLNYLKNNKKLHLILLVVATVLCVVVIYMAFAAPPANRPDYYSMILGIGFMFLLELYLVYALIKIYVPKPKN